MYVEHHILVDSTEYISGKFLLGNKRESISSILIKEEFIQLSWKLFKLF